LFAIAALFTGEKPLLLATKLLWAHTQNANPRSGQAIFDRVAFLSDLYSKPFCNTLFEKSTAGPRSSTTDLLPGPCSGNLAFAQVASGRK